jgi:hypothetical protein
MCSRRGDVERRAFFCAGASTCATCASPASAGGGGFGHRAGRRGRSVVSGELDEARVIRRDHVEHGLQAHRIGLVRLCRGDDVTASASPTFDRPSIPKGDEGASAVLTPLSSPPAFGVASFRSCHRDVPRSLGCAVWLSLEFVASRPLVRPPRQCDKYAQSRGRGRVVHMGRPGRIPSSTRRTCAACQCLTQISGRTSADRSPLLGIPLSLITYAALA